MTESFAQLFEESLKEIETRPGSIVRGVVVAIDKDVVLVDAGLKSESAIPAEQFKNAQGELEIQVGDEVDVALDAVEDGFGETLLSREKAKRHEAWITLEKAYEDAETVTGVINGKVKGGFTVELNGIRAFLPGSLVDVRPVRDTLHLEGKELEFKVIKLDQKRNNVVVSRRAVIESENSAERDQLLENLQEGMEVKGIVKNLTDYGAFVDLGGVDGLIHVSELSWKHIDHPSEVVKVGDKVTVEVLDVDLDRERISLSLKATQEDPWQRFARTHVPGQIVKGKVTKIVQFGVFISVEDGIEGLVHISELANRHVENPETVVKPGEEVFVKVIDVDLDRRRISLSLKQANDSVDPASEDFDPALYGMPAEYDEQGNYKYPEGFDPATNEWIAGYEKQREEWESQYATAHDLWEQHKEFVAKELENAEASAAEDGQAPKEEKVEEVSSNYSSENTSAGTLADSDQLAALRDQLLGK